MSYTNEEGEPIMDGAAYRYEQSLNEQAECEPGDPYDDDLYDLGY